MSENEIKSTEDLKRLYPGFVNQIVEEVWAHFETDQEAKRKARENEPRFKEIALITHQQNVIEFAYAVRMLVEPVGRGAH